MPRTSFAATRRRRSPVPILLAIVLILILGLLIYADVKKKEVPTSRIEQDVTNELAH